MRESVLASPTASAEYPTRPPVLKRLDNIDVLCADVASMERFYREVLELPHVLPYDPDQGWAGFQAGDVTIFLIGSSEAPGPRRIPGAGPPGFESFAFQVDDLEQAIAEFERRGVTWAAEVVESRWYRYRSFYDPEGNILHLTMPDRVALGLDPA